MNTAKPWIFENSKKKLINMSRRFQDFFPSILNPCFDLQMDFWKLRKNGFYSVVELKQSNFLLDIQFNRKYSIELWTRIESECCFNLDSNQIANLNFQNRTKLKSNVLRFFVAFWRCVFHGQKQFIFSKWHMRQVINKMF